MEGRLRMRMEGRLRARMEVVCERRCGLLPAMHKRRRSASTLIGYMSLASTQPAQRLSVVMPEPAESGAAAIDLAAEWPGGAGSRSAAAGRRSAAGERSAAAGARSAVAGQLSIAAARRAAGRIFTATARRLLDLTVAGVLLLVLSPLLAAIALAIRIDSRGPALFRQRRVGREQREFTILKFRTMRSDADAAPHRHYVQNLIGGPASSERGRLYKLSVDDRVTRVGRLL